ncbi:hypothetical protein H6P81_015768 [Aristolochia fimbriata]|uniref:Coiled-coil domain-containing protein R3HCC1L n=1 Tax=Aristolochia fimbriata TaxID=158543 RepID=A0AAV7E6H7_ARIFI|nr:hypothetical protein H6P81_015768 [Aristolochia fimbriata]
MASMAEKEKEAKSENWSEEVEELVANGDVERAISLLESVISKLEATPNSSPLDLQLSCALADLAHLYQSQGFSIKADELHNRALLIRLTSQQQNQSVQSGVLESVNKDTKDAAPANDATPSDDDDWESVADRTSHEVLFPKDTSGVENLSLEDTTLKVPKRRGRGTFLYKEDGMYSDQVPSTTAFDDAQDGASSIESRGPTELRNAVCGTSHVLVLAGFPLSTRTTDLERMFKDFRDGGVAIRWVNDTTALAVFRSPSIARQARNSIDFPFNVHTLDENDNLLTSLSAKELEPPYPRPKTSARTAQRLIAQGMGCKLPKAFGSEELKKQEEARKNRIVLRQSLRDEAWGSDDP